MSGDQFGDRMKSYEKRETGRTFIPGIPVYARIDGRGFSNFTKGMDRPYDKIMSDIMIQATKDLVDHTVARIGYTQSDEISLVWLAEDENDVFFAGKVQKMTSVLASLATAFFTRALLASRYAHLAERLPHFDARVFQLPSKIEATNAFLWREVDATKNAVSMAARAYYPHNELEGKKSAEMQEMIFAKGWNFNDYPSFFKRGTYVQRKTVERPLSEEERNRIDGKYRPPADKIFTRSSVEALELPRLGSIANRVDVIFDGADWILIEENMNQDSEGKKSLE